MNAALRMQQVPPGPAAAVPAGGRQALWLSQGLLLLVAALHVPWWLVAAAAVALTVCAAQSKSPDGRWGAGVWRGLQLAAFVGGLGGLWATFRTLVGVDAGVGFLLVCLVAKWFEVRQPRDVSVVLNLSLFVLGTLFLFDQGLTTAAAVLLGVLLVLWAQGRQVLGDHRQAARALFETVALAVPLMVVLFLFMPRLPPLWSVQVAGGQARTGVSDQIAPGDVAQLSQSTELAFRVEVLAGQWPSRQSLYWRGLVMSQFDGVRWSVAQDARASAYHVPHQTMVPPWLEQAVSSPKPLLRYRLSMKRTGQPWLFALAVPYAPTPAVQVNRDLLLRSQIDLNTDQDFEVLQLPAAAQHRPLPDWERRLNTWLPAAGNPQAHGFAQTLWQKTGRDPVRYNRAVLAWIRQQRFFYTLTPPPLSGDRIDRFLFGTRRGFCEHYASAHAFLMRAAGVPARLVAGYQGGQRGQDGQSWEVRQMDAHAWVEVWLDGQGWVRVDPTAAVAPERIERGMADLSSQSPQIFGDDVAGVLRAQRFRWVGQARQWADYASYLWQRDVVGFDQAAQTGWLARLGIGSTRAQLLWLMALVALVVCSVAIWLGWRQRRQVHRLDRPLLWLSARLDGGFAGRRAQAHTPWARQPSETVRDWMARLVAERPALAVEAQALTALYEMARYGQIDARRERELARRLQQQASRLWRVWRQAARGG